MLISTSQHPVQRQARGKHWVIILLNKQNSKWLKDNSLFIQNVGKSVLFERVKISEGFLDFLEQNI